MNSEYDFNKEVSDKYSLRGRVFHKIRNDILNGRYKEHEELKEIRIGKELGVSRTPVREALRQLELEGLVQIIPNRGAFVTGIQENDVRDIYAIRALLEGLCARWATERITPEQLEAMEENVYLAEFHAGKGHMEQMAELDNQFHHTLYRACDSKMLEHLLNDYHEYRHEKYRDNYRYLQPVNGIHLFVAVIVLVVVACVHPLGLSVIHRRNRSSVLLGLRLLAVGIVNRLLLVDLSVGRCSASVVLANRRREIPCL